MHSSNFNLNVVFRFSQQVYPIFGTPPLDLQAIELGLADGGDPKDHLVNQAWDCKALRIQ